VHAGNLSEFRNSHKARAAPARPGLRYLLLVLTVISWYSARRSRRELAEWVQRALTDKPTLLAIVADKYTQESHLRPFAPVAERFGDRLHVILAAEWEQPERERDGELALAQLGLAPAARQRVLHDEGKGRTGVVLRQKQPVALIELFFEERGYTTLDGRPDPRADEIRAREDHVVRQLEDLLVRLPPPPPPPSRALKPGEHDFSPQGLCRFCAQGKATLTACPGTRRDDGPRRDRFELIELD
jgi:uncharacterized protein YjiS (DUF1127 family)